MRLYNFDFGSEPIGTDNEHIAGIFYKLSHIKFEASSVSSYSIGSLIDGLNKLIFVIEDIKIFMNKFLVDSGDAVNADTACVVVFTFNETIQIARNTLLMDDVIAFINEKKRKKKDRGGRQKPVIKGERPTIKQEMSAAFLTITKKLLDIVPVILDLDEQAIDQTKQAIINNAKEKVEANGWVFFTISGKNGLFKMHPGNSGIIQIATEPCSDLRVKGGTIYYDATETYSTFDEKSYEYNRYSDSVTYKIMPDNEEPIAENRSRGYLGSSN